MGRYWEPGAWRLPEGAAHVYFIGPWRLLTAAMLREAVRANTETLRCRVMTTWRTVPLRGLRSLSGFARKSGLDAVASGASFAGKLVAGAPRAAVDAGSKLAVIRSTLFIRHLDSLPETLVASALADADGRGVDRVTIFFSHVVEPEILGKLLEDRRVASVGTKDAQFESLLPPALLSDVRVGRYWEPGNWTLPEPAEHVYFVGPWTLITPEMIGEALRRDVASLRVRVATSWATVPLARIRSGLPLLRFVRPDCRRCAPARTARDRNQPRACGAGHPGGTPRLGGDGRAHRWAERDCRPILGTRLQAHAAQPPGEPAAGIRPDRSRVRQSRSWRRRAAGDLYPAGPRRARGSTSLCSATSSRPSEGIATTSTYRRSKPRAYRPGRSAAALRRATVRTCRPG